MNLWDPEPGYYTQSCYFGEKEILAIGMTAAIQRDGAGVAGNPADFSAESIDFLWEHKVATCGVIDIEGGFYKYNYGNVPSAARSANQGDSEYVQLSYLLPTSIGYCGVTGKLQPFARYQYYARDFRTAAATLSSTASPLFFEGVDIGVNYVISGYNARVTVAWGQRDSEDGSSFGLLRSGVQLQF